MLAAAVSPAAAHAAFSSDLLCLSWRADAWIVGGVFLSSWLYAAGVQRIGCVARHSIRLWAWRTACFFGGLAVLAVALLSPLDALGKSLFSMHMLQHELLMLAAAPLLVAGRPLAVFIWAFPPMTRLRIAGLIGMRAVRGSIRGSWAALTRPLVAWSAHTVILWGWHVPILFQASLADESVHTAQHLSFLLSALLFWSSLAGSRSRRAVPYLLTTAMHTGMLGALLTFSQRPWYPVYAGRIADGGLTVLEDQQLGGLIMWVPAGFVFVFAGLVFAARVFAQPAGSRP